MGQWKVIDANFLRSPELEFFLRADPDNRVVFTEFNCMECYKGDSLINIERSTKIVSGYSGQVVVLKGAREIIALQSKGATKPRDFVDEKQTRGLSDYYAAVRRALGGDDRLKSQILQHGRAAAKNLDNVLMDSSKFADGVRMLEGVYSSDVLKRLKRGELPGDIVPVLIEGALVMSAASFKDHPDATRVPSFQELPDSFIFRYSLMGQLLAHRWIADGGIATVKPKRLANDLVDLNHVVYATYFDGFLSHERKWLELHDQAAWILREGLDTWRILPAQEPAGGRAAFKN